MAADTQNSVPHQYSGLKPFPKGVSGNPGGRPKAVGEFRSKCREYSDEALETLLEVMRSKATNTTMPAKVSAARTLLAYGFGEPSNMEDTDNAQLVINVLRLVGGIQAVNGVQAIDATPVTVQRLSDNG